MVHWRGGYISSYRLKYYVNFLLQISEQENFHRYSLITGVEWQSGSLSVTNDFLISVHTHKFPLPSHKYIVCIR